MFNYFVVKFGLAYIIDLILGDPRWLYHPVIIIGKLISFLEKFLYKAKNKTDGKIIGAYTLTQNLRTILPYKPSVEFENSDIVKNDEVSSWNIGLVTINGDENDPNSYQVAGNLNYDDFIKKLPINKYKFIDASYIMVEPLSKEEILDLLK